MKLRKSNIEKLEENTFDVLVVGGGINGAVAAAALSGRGAKVALIDKGDFASLTSQESSNLAWGGIKYLESFEFGLVRKLCISRNHLIRSFPSSVKEIRFLTTHYKGFRHGLWKIYLGTWLYWFMGNCFTRPPQFFSKKKLQTEEPIIDVSQSDGGFEYSDAYFYDNDSRFVFNFIRSAINFGCITANYVESIQAKRNEKGLWITTAKDLTTHKEIVIQSKIIINACGPYVDQFNTLIQQQTKHQHVLSKGIHLIVNRVTPNKRVLAFFAQDGRLFFVIPLGNKTCIGTTDNRVDQIEAKVTEEDRIFILENINQMLKLNQPLAQTDIIAERCGVRPLVVSETKSRKPQPNGETSNSDFLTLSRKHEVEIDSSNAVISIFGGKLTDCLNVGEEICEAFEKDLGLTLPKRDKVWYGEDPDEIKQKFMDQAEAMELDKMTDEESSEMLSSRLWRRYGGQAIQLLEAIRENPQMSEVLIKGTEYIRVEIQLAAKSEMVTKLDDFLRRRSKIALVERKEVIKQSSGIMDACQILFGDQAQEKFDEYFI